MPQPASQQIPDMLIVLGRNAERVLEALGSPDYSLEEIAAANEVSLEALAAFMALPDIAERLAALKSAAAARAQQAALAQLPYAIAALGILLRDFSDQAMRVPMRSDMRSLALQQRQRETARRAAALLLRLSRPAPTPRPTPTPTPTPAPTQAPPHPRIQSPRPPLPHAPTPRPAPTPSLPTPIPAFNLPQTHTNSPLLPSDNTPVSGTFARTGGVYAFDLGPAVALPAPVHGTRRPP